ncbi:MFS transporter [Streptomyces fuscichromogenes]|uniref:MFS transporter n=1 Tax=Streptomyces fuscichromogenes TaxID=1324013 RepID=A0A917XN29_9ACTN|nr:MFS transporter [Streptomyces fuscichromogenes]GGN42411.1 MFS transporter [Streptomyces fuscichromogenes]
MSRTTRTSRVSRERPHGVRSAAFRRLSWAWAVSMCGDGARAVALPLYVTVHSHAPLAVAAVATAETLPWLLGALPAGALVDRLPPRTVLVVAHALRAVATAGLVAVLTAGAPSVAVLCAFAFVLTALELFADPASQVMMVRLARPDELEAANSRFYSISTVATGLVGPLAGSALFAVGPVWAFALDGLTFVVSAGLTATLPAPGGPAATAGPRRPRVRSEMAEGARLLLGHPELRALVVLVAAAGLAVSAVNTLLPLYAVDQLAFGPRAVGLVVTVFGVAALLGAVLAARLPARVGGARAMISGMAAAGAAFTAFALFPRPAVLWLGCALAGTGLGLWNVLCSSRRQRLTPPAVLGRVSGVYRMLAWGLNPVGSALAGIAAAATTVRAPLLLAGVLVLAVLAALAPVLRREQNSSPDMSTCPPDAKQLADVPSSW